MANSIAKFKKYIDLLDEVYKYESKSAILDMDGGLVTQGANANEIIIPKITMDGLATYSRNSGFVNGDVTLTNETVQYNYDRGRAFTVDAMDNDETAGIAFGKLASEFIRTKVVPELDAFRFAQYASTENIGKAYGSISTGSAAITALRSAVTALDDAEVPADGRYLFITSNLHGLLQDMDTTKSREILSGFTQIIDVPQSRFVSKITLYDGTTEGQTSGGYAKADDGVNINFLVIHKSAVIQYSKHTVNKVISPELNQDSDGWKFMYRSYGLSDVYENKVGGIYLHTVSTTETAAE